MTRSRAVEANTPNALLAEYYGRRASAGLIITEGASPSPNGLGYPRIPGLYNQAQVAGWKLVTNAVHAKGGKIFLQLMHTGRVTAAGNLPSGAEVVGPTAEVCPGEMYADGKGMQPHSAPRAMTEKDIAHAVAAIGADRAGIRLSPYAAFNSKGGYPDVEAQTIALVKELPAVPRQPRSGRAHAQQRCTERTGHGDVLYPWRQGLHRLSNTHRMNSKHLLTQTLAVSSGRFTVFSATQQLHCRRTRKRLDVFQLALHLPGARLG